MKSEDRNRQPFSTVSNGTVEGVAKAFTETEKAYSLSKLRFVNLL
jgi:hypothetical protein